MHVPDLPGGSVADRLQAARKLKGLSQLQLAQRMNFSTSLVKKVEQGTKPPSAAFVAGAARVLGVKVATLYGTRENEVLDEPSQQSTGIADLRSALDAYDDPRPEGDSLTLDAVTARLAAASDRVLALRHAEVLSELPNLLHHLYVLAAEPGHAGELARAALHDAYRMSATVAGRFRQADLAAIASERHVQLAPRTGDSLRIAISAYHRSTRYLQHGDYRNGLRLLDRARAHVGAGSTDRAVAIQLDLRAAILAARAGDPAEADDYLGEARAFADEFAPPAVPYYGVDASATNIVVHWCATPVENYNGTEAVRRASTVTVADPRRPERVGHHHIDMARAWMLHGDRGKTLDELNAARRVAPNATRHHPSVTETVRALATAERRTTDSLAGFAQWAGIRL
ncbi:transcriptional regulator with XRE-family HTH domain [Amycolatopsis echigonensis]|uniref:Transcriptional regulator with XRE-family HTH domain n=1 Tax=Amycolatopsis echigonensis TaxID=2576905 RepID=A0A2N3X2A2_9PSEU|nr:helix-turn-helix transcriptional regulator [Amycolatopsis niigatensis]PKW00238.1 transcriptional regulator with XRE-family HTH domain [Amycolatopsis niigatensis]